MKYAIDGDKYSDERSTDPDSDLSDDKLTRQNLSFVENHSLRTQYLHQ